MATVEERLERLEKEVTLLKLSQSSKIDLAAKKLGWIAKIQGSFNDAPISKRLSDWGMKSDRPMF